MPLSEILSCHEIPALTSKTEAPFWELLSIAPLQCALYKKALQPNWNKTLEHENEDGFVAK